MSKHSTECGVDYAKSSFAYSYKIPPVYDATPVGDDPMDRHHEILGWLSSHEIAQWVALDDLPMPQLGAHAVQVLTTTHHSAC